ncbi:MAG: peptidase M14, partial [Bacteroidales bacterium]|nr:peptidase M14 [Bacteroidales bacterium]
MRKLFGLLLCLTLAWGAAAQDPVPLSYFLPDTCNYDKHIPTPSSVLGFEVGEFQITPEQGVAYVKALAAASDRVLLRQYGWTHERRPLYLLIISTEENIRNIDRIKAEHDLLSDPSADGKTSGPVFNWFGNSIHGNETSGFNASLLLAYHLAAANTPYTQKVLESNIVLIDPMINPDGIGRFTEWVNSHRSAVANPDSQELEHTETWPGGRSNHYWFD